MKALPNIKKLIFSKKFLIGTVVLSSIVTVFINSFFSKKIDERKKKRELLQTQYEIKRELTSYLSKNGDFPEEINLNTRTLKLKYTFDQELQEYVRNLLAEYKSDFSSVVVIDNETGHILVAEGYNRQENKFDVGLAFSSTHPSASLFKIITSAELIERAKIDPQTNFTFSGRSTTLYRYQLKDGNNRWARNQTLEKAFAVSNNVIFGKAAMSKLNAPGIIDRATQMGFNQQLMLDLELGKSILMEPESQYNLAEMASGLNTETTISPVHAALLASIVGNEGILRYPKIVSEVSEYSVEDSKENDGPLEEKKLNLFDRSPKRVLSIEAARELSQMMQQTIIQGTARSSFRKMSSRIKDGLEIGGKTGTITGGTPHGKRDWFAVYAKPRNNLYGQGISICVMNINVNRWYVKSTYLAKSIIEHYFNRNYNTVHNLSRSGSKRTVKSEV